MGSHRNCSIDTNFRLLWLQYCRPWFALVRLTPIKINLKVNTFIALSAVNRKKTSPYVLRWNILEHYETDVPVCSTMFPKKKNNIGSLIFQIVSYLLIIFYKYGYCDNVVQYLQCNKQEASSIIWERKWLKGDPYCHKRHGEKHIVNIFHWSIRLQPLFLREQRKIHQPETSRARRKWNDIAIPNCLSGSTTKGWV